MKFKRISALILSVIMLFAAAGCGGKTANKGEILTAINPNNTNRFYYSVIYPSDSSDEVESAAKKIRTELKAAFDVYVEANKDEKVEADSNNHLQVIMVHFSLNLARALGLNYPKFSDSCRFFQLAI